MTVPELRDRISTVKSYHPIILVAYKNDEVRRFCPRRPLSNLSGTGNGL
ncbi:hypothetical protein [Xenorhabdus ishibashii]|nr:hypothetical protein [Xenorhabdus ishibashii]